MYPEPEPPPNPPKKPMAAKANAWKNINIEVVLSSAQRWRLLG
jgi:hypothetical protein